MGGRNGACANPIFYAETAGTAQGVDVALPYGGGWGGHGACANPIFYVETAGTAQGVDVALLYGGVGGGMERVQTQFFMQKPLEQRKELM